MHGEPRQYGAIVIGSGPGGSACARALALRGKSVCLLERGGEIPHTDVCGEYSGCAFLCRARSLERTASTADTCFNRLQPGRGALTGHALGGASAVNFSLWITPSKQDLDKALPEQMITDDIVQSFLSDIDDVITDEQFGMTEMHRRVAQVLPPQSQVITRGRPAPKLPPNDRLSNGLHLTHDKTVRVGRHLRSEGGVRRNAWEALAQNEPNIVTRDGFDVDYIEAAHEGWIVYSSRVPDPECVAAPMVFVACSALETPQLLMRSFPGQLSPQIGKNLCDHDQSSTAYPLCCCCGAHDIPSSRMPERSPVGFVYGSHSGKVNAQVTHLPWAFSCPARPYNCCDSVQAFLSTGCCALSPHWLPYGLCYSDLRMEAFRITRPDGEVQYDTETNCAYVVLPTTDDDVNKLANEHRMLMDKAVRVAIGGAKGLTLPWRSSWHYTGTANAIGQITLQGSARACDAYAHVLDRHGEQLLKQKMHQGIYVADNSLARFPPMANGMSMAAFCGYAAAMRALQREEEQKGNMASAKKLRR